MKNWKLLLKKSRGEARIGEEMSDEDDKKKIEKQQGDVFFSCRLRLTLPRIVF